MSKTTDLAHSLLTATNDACGALQNAIRDLHLTTPVGNDLGINDADWYALLQLDADLIRPLRKVVSALNSALRKADGTITKQVDLAAGASAAGATSDALEFNEIVGPARVAWSAEAVEQLLVMLAPPGTVYHYDSVVREAQQNGILPETQRTTTVHVQGAAPGDVFKGATRKDNL